MGVQTQCNKGWCRSSTNSRISTVHCLSDQKYHEVCGRDRKPFCADLKTIYQAPTEEKALDALERVTEKWSGKYPNFMKSWN